MPLWLTIVVAVAGLIVHALTLITIIAGAVRKWLDHELNGLGIRLDEDIEELKKALAELEKAEATLNQAREGADKRSLTQEFQIAQLQRETGEVKGILNQLVKALEDTKEARFQHEKELTKQLAQFESNLDVADALREGVDKLVKVLVRGREGR